MHAHGWWSPVLLGLIAVGCPRTVPLGVRPGIDVLLADSVHLVRGRRVGLLTNQTGVDAHGTDDIRRLLDAGVRLTAIFSPEHGFRGLLDVENIGHGVDSATGLDIFSLYGGGSVRAPTPEMLKSVDVLLVDLQDVGGRTYTFVSTALLALRAASALGLPVIVLDRPNPIGGLVQGPVLDAAFASDVGMLPVPLRHGMTIGELVRLGNDALGIHGALTVVPVAGWSRATWFDRTGLPWVRPSPSMPDLESATHYPGIVLFEATPLSVGRGTPIAFQVVGAPWLDPGRVIAAVGAVPGVALRDTVLVPRAPQDGKFADTPVRAIRFRVTDRTRYDPVAFAARLLAAVRVVHGSRLTVSARRFDQLSGSPRLREVVERGEDVTPLLSDWARASAVFMRTRAPFLLYHDELP